MSDMTLADWAALIDQQAIEAIEAGSPLKARELIECAEAFERRQLQIERRDFGRDS